MTMSPLKKTWAGLVLGLSIAGFSFAAATPAHAAVAASGTYITQDNDTFWVVSRKLGIPLQDLLDANRGIDPLNVYAGITFKLPGTVHDAAAGAPKVLAAETKAAAPAPAPQEPTVATASGSKLAYSKQLNAVATAYTGSPEENGGWGGIDYFGNALRFGTIAVDPNMIPLGSKVYVTGYKFAGMPDGFVATASDVGGAIKGGRIDIFMPHSVGKAEDFGMQNVNLYVLK
ncbi:hypothetical protein SD70_00135 [Gordoniibacillus kamchatkensis]|uniref:LysM domain-containing protein n=1 Tax=Gordoniibacillus kamchatkensis TaxID=1590651 RepID=A0ABR5APU4_9BACL|nr:3D domain-containing protein [Paenibacillus sp. VKM B-2647]KIL42387.1 hypothetical protein SD70_00135 [Paenibacillus sp. VKM B-2647]